MLAFTGSIRELDAKEAHDSLMARYQAKLAQRSAAMAATSGGRTGLPLELTYFMAEDAVIEHLKIMAPFRVDGGPDCLSYVFPNSETNSTTTLVCRFDNGKLVQITDGKCRLTKAAFDPYMVKLKAIAAQWKERGMRTVFTDDSQMRYVYEDAQSFVCIFGAPDKRADVYMAGIEFTEKTYQFNHDSSATNSDNSPSPAPPIMGAPILPTETYPKAVPLTTQSLVWPEDEIAIGASIGQFIRNLLEASVKNDFTSETVFYANDVDYFDNGMVDSAHIMADNANYDRKWPVKSYQMGDVLDFKCVETDVYYVDFRLGFSVQNGATEKNGVVDCQMKIRKTDGTWQIIMIKQHSMKS
jgi:hypothetical protein